MKIALMTAGAAGMYCGSCLRDNALARALTALGEEALLIPTYTPIRSDEESASIDRVFFGGLNVYLKQRWPFLRRMPRFVERLLDSPRLLNCLTYLANSTDPTELGDLTISMLRGEDGNQNEELETLVQWLQSDVKPDIVNLPNALFAGMAGRIKQHLNVPVVCTLTGEDIFLEGLAADDRNTALELASEKCRDIDGFISTSSYYADFVSDYLDVDRNKIHVVPPGIAVGDFLESENSPRTGTPVIGYFARICPEKGLHVLIDAFLNIKADAEAPDCRLRVAGYLGKRDEGYLRSQVERVKAAGHEDDFECLGTLDRAEKIRFLNSLDILSVPTTYREPKGIFLIEAWAAGLPVVQPEHGCFPELIKATGGGLLFEPGNSEALASRLIELIQNSDMRTQMGEHARTVVQESFTDVAMAERVLKVYQRYTEN